MATAVVSIATAVVTMVTIAEASAVRDEMAFEGMEWVNLHPF
jgi:hypothetical protein